MTILIERRLATASFWMPVEKGWIDPGLPIEIVDAPSSADLRQHQGLAIVDSLRASTALESSVIVRDHGVMMDQISLLTLVTADRPDEIERASVATPGVSLTGRAVAEIVIPSFYGIEISGWSNDPGEIGPESAVITEDAAALLPTSDEAHYHEDLGRAWFLLTNTPFVSHVCIAPEDLYASNPAALREASLALDRIVATANDQRRMLRRNIARDHDIDRDLVVDVFDALQLKLSDAGIEGLKTLYHRSGVLQRTGSIDERIITLVS